MGGTADFELYGAPMLKLLKIAVVIGLLSGITDRAIAQTETQKCPRAGTSMAVVQVTSLLGCPFSADVIFDINQTLADGTHIDTKIKARVCRDVLGRIRYESFTPSEIAENASAEPSLIEIYDPVEGYNYVLLPMKSSATRHKTRDAETTPQPQHRQTP
jgi:hypothetical protein